MEVKFLPEVREYFRELALILYKKEYFGFREDAKRYARKLFNDIQKDLPNKQKKQAPEYFSKYGDNLQYAVFKRNNVTEWYVFFEIYPEQKVYVVTYIENNHTIAQHL